MKRVAYRLSKSCGLIWKDDGGITHHQSELPEDIQTRLVEYFSYFAWDDNKAKELAQMALDNIPIPKGWIPFKEKI